MENSELESLKAYSKALDNLACNKSKDTFPNKNHKHASVALCKILKYSKNDFIIFDDDLKGDIVNHQEVVSFKDSLIEFISRGGKVKIVISDKYDDEDDKNLKDFLKLLIEIFPDNVELKIASTEFKASMRKIYNEKINFAIGDNNKFRLELFGNNSVDNKTRKAVGSFNNEAVTNKLLSVFSSNYSSCLDY